MLASAIVDIKALMEVHVHSAQLAHTKQLPVLEHVCSVLLASTRLKWARAQTVLLVARLQPRQLACLPSLSVLV